MRRESNVGCFSQLTNESHSNCRRLVSTRVQLFFKNICLSLIKWTTTGVFDRYPLHGVVQKQYQQRNFENGSTKERLVVYFYIKDDGHSPVFWIWHHQPYHEEYDIRPLLWPPNSKYFKDARWQLHCNVTSLNAIERHFVSHSRTHTLS